MISLATSTFDTQLVWANRGAFLHGLLVAAEVSCVALVLSLMLGLLLAVARMSKPPFTWISSFYVNLFRGIPALVTVLWVYFGLALLLNIDFSTFEAGVVALTLLYSAFMCEIYRAALEAIPNGQREAGFALGMRPTRVFWNVVLPQATKIALPNIGSMYIGMVKDTSVFTVIGLTEIVRVAQNLNATYYEAFTLYTAAAILYVALAFVVDFVVRTLEKTMQTPPRGALAQFVAQRRRRRVAAVVGRLTSQ